MSEETMAIVTPKKNALKTTAWTFFFLFSLVVFTLSKLPEARITNLIQGYIQVGLDPYGIYMSDHGREFSIIRGFQYKLIQPALELSDQTRIEFDEILVSPSFSALLKGQAGAEILLKQGSTLITLNGSGRGDKINATLHLDQADLGKLGILAYAANIKGSGLITGDAHIEGGLSDLPSLTGLISLKLSKIHLDEQNLMGFQLPVIAISEGAVEIPIEHGKLVMKDVHLGKSGSTSDDLIVNLSGDVTLSRFVNASALNLRANIGFSDKLKASLSILDSIIGSAKQADGKYVYKLTGSLGSPFPVPDPK